MVDLHVHSNCSDGTFSPRQLVEYGLKKKLSAFALTDHDSIDGLDEALSAAEGTSLTIVPGIELSSFYQEKDIHILGLFVNTEDPGFLETVQDFREERFLRNKKMVENFQRGGFSITAEEIGSNDPRIVVTRAHFAKALLNHGYVKTMQEAFVKYLKEDSVYYVPRKKISPAEAVSILLENKALPVLAHPLLYGLSESQLEHLISSLKEAGLAGLEVYHSTTDISGVKYLLSLAENYNLLPSGGSDFHGSNKPHIDLGTGMGNLHIDDHILLKLQDYKENTL